MSQYCTVISSIIIIQKKNQNKTGVYKVLRSITACNSWLWNLIVCHFLLFCFYYILFVMHELFEITNYNISSGRNAILFRSLFFTLWFPGVYQNKIKQTKKPETEHSLISENIWKRNVITSIQFPQHSSFCLFISICTAAAILVVYIFVLRWAVRNRTAISRTPTATSCHLYIFLLLPPTCPFFPPP